jgi:hypothetical protein
MKRQILSRAEWNAILADIKINVNKIEKNILAMEKEIQNLKKRK